MRDGGALAFFCSDSGRCFVGAFRRFLRGLAFSRFGSGPELKVPISSNQKIIKNLIFYFDFPFFLGFFQNWGSYGASAKLNAFS